MAARSCTQAGLAVFHVPTPCHTQLSLTAPADHPSPVPEDTQQAPGGCGSTKQRGNPVVKNSRQGSQF